MIERYPVVASGLRSYQPKRPFAGDTGLADPPYGSRGGFPGPARSAMMSAGDSRRPLDGNPDMTDGNADRGQHDEAVAIFEISDAALEAAANALPGAAMSFPNAPTVSILFACCSND